MSGVESGSAEHNLDDAALKETMRAAEIMSKSENACTVRAVLLSIAPRVAISITQDGIQQKNVKWMFLLDGQAIVAGVTETLDDAVICVEEARDMWIWEQLQAKIKEKERLKEEQENLVLTEAEKDDLESSQVAAANAEALAEWAKENEP